MKETIEFSKILHSGAKFRIDKAKMVYEFLGITVYKGKLMLVLRDQYGNISKVSSHWLEGFLPEITMTEPERQSIEIPCEDGYDLCATNGVDWKYYPGIYIFSRKDGTEIDLCAAEYQHDEPSPGLHHVYLYENPYTDEYTRKIEISTNIAQEVV